MSGPAAVGAVSWRPWQLELASPPKFARMAKELARGLAKIR